MGRDGAKSPPAFASDRDWLADALTHLIGNAKTVRRKLSLVELMTPARRPERRRIRCVAADPARVCLMRAHTVAVLRARQAGATAQFVPIGAVLRRDLGQPFRVALDPWLTATQPRTSGCASSCRPSRRKTPRNRAGTGIMRSRWCRFSDVAGRRSLAGQVRLIRTGPNMPPTKRSPDGSGQMKPPAQLYL